MQTAPSHTRRRITSNRIGGPLAGVERVGRSTTLLVSLTRPDQIAFWYKLFHRR